MTENLVLVPVGDQCLALTRDQFREALDRGRELVGTHGYPFRGEWRCARALAYRGEDAGAYRGAGNLVSRTGAPGTGAAPPAREVCPVQVR